tara:strand:+ start:385 stop:1320 length:936 start_codon:yes stop_codon:yes gene_type:complete
MSYKRTTVKECMDKGMLEGKELLNTLKVPLRAELHEALANGREPDTKKLLRELLTLVVKRFRGCKYTVVYGRIHIYFPTDHFTMGTISYQDWGVDSVNLCLAVESRLIHNERYDNYRKQHHMVMSVDPSRAFKNACKYIRPYEAAEVEDEYRHLINRECDADDSSKTRTIYSKKDSMTRSKYLTAELQAMVHSGYEFLNPDFSSLVGEYLHEVAEYESTRVAPKMHFVRPYQKEGVQMFEVIHDIDRLDTYPYLPSRNSENPTKAINYTADTLPDNIAGKIALLNMVDREYVLGVGMQVVEGIFYCQADPI